MEKAQLCQAFKQHRSRVWTELETQYGLPHPMPRADREQVDDDFEDELRGITCEADLNEVLASYREAAERSVKTVAMYLVQPTGSADREHRSPRRTSRRRATPPSRRGASVYGRFSDRRYLDILTFVAGRGVPLLYLLAERLNGPNRFRWQRLAQEWNRSHPSDQLKPATLGRYFRRARDNGGVRECYLRDLRAKWRPWADPLLPSLDDQALRMLAKHTDDYIRIQREQVEQTRRPPRPNPRARGRRAAR